MLHKISDLFKKHSEINHSPCILLKGVLLPFPVLENRRAESSLEGVVIRLRITSDCVCGDENGKRIQNTGK